MRYGADRAPADSMCTCPRSEAAERGPVVIFWYGGSWRQRQQSHVSLRGRGARGARLRHRAAGLSPVSRRSNFRSFWTMRAQAVAWVQQHAAEFGGDPQRIVLMGHSAGAHMAAFLALNHEFLAKRGRAAASRSRGSSGLSGPYALAPNSRRPAHDLRQALHRSGLAAGPLRGSSSSPPTFLAHGANDTSSSVAQTEKLRDALRHGDVRVETEILSRTAAMPIRWRRSSGAARHRAPVLERHGAVHRKRQR